MADAHAKPHHDYHLVDPSPWPIVGALSAFILAIGAIVWMHQCPAAPLLFGAGVSACSTPCMLVERCRQGSAAGRPHPRGSDSHRYGMILFIASEVMFFVAWFWAYFDVALFPARRASGAAATCSAASGRHCLPPRHVPGHLRSLAPAAAQHADPADLGHHGDLGAPRAAARRPQGPEQGPVADHPARRTFTCVQAYEYGTRASPSGHIYGATFFMATGFHGAHVLIGTTS